MYEIISALRQSSIVLDVEVLEVIDEDSVKLIKIKAVLKDSYLLYITELHTKHFQEHSVFLISDAGIFFKKLTHFQGKFSASVRFWGERHGNNNNNENICIKLHDTVGCKIFR